MDYNFPIEARSTPAYGTKLNL